jgi:hypothetical protein
MVLTPIKVLCFSFLFQNYHKKGDVLKLGNRSKSKELLQILTVASCSHLVASITTISPNFNCQLLLYSKKLTFKVG